MKQRPGAHSTASPTGRFIALEKYYAESGASAIFFHSSAQVVPGLLQNRAYWYALSAHFPRTDLSPPEQRRWRDTVWRERAQRQHLVARSALGYTFYISPAALDMIVELCDRKVAAAQLGRLARTGTVRLASQGLIPPDSFYGMPCPDGSWQGGVWYENPKDGAAYASCTEQPETCADLAAMARALGEGALNITESQDVLRQAQGAVRAGTWEAFRCTLDVQLGV